MARTKANTFSYLKTPLIRPPRYYDQRPPFVVLSPYFLYKITPFITYRAKLLNADWFRQRAFFLNFPSMEGKITRSWLAERQNLLAPDWLSAPFLHLVGFLKSFAQNFLTRDGFKIWLLSRLIPFKSMEIVLLILNFTRPMRLPILIRPVKFPGEEAQWRQTQSDK